MKITISKEFIDFIYTCFNPSKYNTQHEQYREKGEYPLIEVLKAYDKFCFGWTFAYNCEDCSFPKFKNNKTSVIESCPICGD